MNKLTRGDLASSIDAMADHLLVDLNGLKSKSWLGTDLPMLVRAGSLPRRTMRVEPERKKIQNIYYSTVQTDDIISPSEARVGIE